MFVVLLLILLYLPGCAGRTEADPNAVTMALDVAPTNLDPRIGTDVSSARLFELVFNGLVRTNEEFDVVPDLATHWETPNATTYIFHLRTDVRFHDGRPLTAKDVLYTFNSVMNGTIRTPKVGAYRPIESIQAPDDFTVIFTLKEPNASFLLNLTPGTMGIIPEGSPADFSRTPIGSGPFKFVRYIQDQEVVIERNNDFYGTKPNVETVTFKIIPEAIVRALELRKGSIDIASNVLPADMVEALRGVEPLEVMQSPGTNYQYIAFNLKDPIFSDLRIRQAIAHAIDREEIAKYLWRDQVRLASSIIPPNNWAHEPDVMTYPHDTARAKQLLKEAGQSNLSFTFRASTDELTRLMVAALQQQFRNVGINMEIRSNEFATFFADVQKGNFQMYSLRWTGNNDPDIFNLIFNSTMTPPNGSNRGFYSNPDVDQLIQAGRRETDPEKRKEAYQAIQRIVARDLPYVSLWYNDVVCVYNKRIKGLKLSPNGSYEFLINLQVETPTD